MIAAGLRAGLPILANLSRLVRSAMLDALGQDYIRTARAKGVERARRASTSTRCATRCIPFVTSVGIMTGYLLGGAIVVEQVFAIPGLGRLILGAIAERNYPLIQATILVVTCGFVLVNFVVDLLYLGDRSAGAGMSDARCCRHPLLAFAVALRRGAGLLARLRAAGSRPTTRWRRT